MAYEVRLDSFEGPLDLLLHLIDKAEVDIYDIPVTIITEQYMQHLYVMQEFQIEIASEFLVMAATLLEIKSKMLLPRKEEVIFQPMLEIEEEYIDPRQELVERLLEYKRFKKLAEDLRDRETKRSKIFTRPAENLSSFMVQVEENPVANVTLYDLVEAFNKALNKAEKQETKITKVHRDEISVKERIREIKELLSITGNIRFSQLFSSTPSKAEVVTSFMAILEMMRKLQIRCLQSTLFEDIIITANKGDEQDAGF